MSSFTIDAKETAMRNQSILLAEDNPDDELLTLRDPLARQEQGRLRQRARPTSNCLLIVIG